MGNDRTELQQDIIDEHKKDSDQTDEVIAAKLNCSASYVNQVRNDYEDSGGGGLFWVVIVILIIIVLVGMSDSGSGATPAISTLLTPPASVPPS
jgi:hypothetical protein